MRSILEESPQLLLISRYLPPSIMSSTRKDKKCDICSRCFARSEHLVRHRRTHTKEKPYPCPHCGRAFQRCDARDVHVKKCYASPDNDLDGSERKRVRIACGTCRRRKLRCDSTEPCGTCRASNSHCEYYPPIGSSAAALNSPSRSDSTRNEELQGPMSHVDAQLNENLNSATRQNRPGSTCLDIAATIDPLEMMNESVSASCPEVLSEHRGANSAQSIVAPDLHHHEFYPLPDADTGGVDDFWQAPFMNSEFWFDQSEIDWDEHLFEATTPMLDYEMPSPLSNLTSMMQEYFDRKSRPSSPSPAKANKVWYSAPPRLDNHNRDIIRVFHNVFRRHVPKTFSLFEDTTAISPKNQPAFTLALAATGGLFCTTPGSAQVARSMYDDARRMVLSTVNTRTRSDDLPACRVDKLTVAKTFVLLALYGLCSGDKRSYEFLEVFHGNLIHSVQEYSKACQSSTHTDDVDKDNTRLLEALHILDCYRVIIMQRPPSLARKYSESFIRTPTNQSRISKLHNVIAGLVGGGHTVDLGSNTTFGLTSLASLSSFVWPATYPQQNVYGADKSLSDDLFMWRADFAELACDTWLRTIHRPENLSHLVIYHMIGIILHSNLTVLQNFAHSAPGSAARDSKRGLAAREIHAWTKDRHYTTAHWHAENMIASIEAALTEAATARQAQHSSARSSSLHTELPGLSFEAPHVPYAVYYASLVLWSGKFTVPTLVKSVLSERAQLARGEQILLVHKVHIAQLLARLLGGIR